MAMADNEIGRPTSDPLGFGHDLGPGQQSFEQMLESRPVRVLARVAALQTARDRSQIGRDWRRLGDVVHTWEISAPSPFMSCAKPGKLVSMGAASSIQTEASAPRPSTRKAMAMR